MLVVAVVTLAKLGCSINGSWTHGATLTRHDVSSLGRAILLRTFRFDIFSGMEVRITIVVVLLLRSTDLQKFFRTHIWQAKELLVEGLSIGEHLNARRDMIFSWVPHTDIHIRLFLSRCSHHFNDISTTHSQSSQIFHYRDIVWHLIRTLVKVIIQLVGFLKVSFFIAVQPGAHNFIPLFTFIWLIVVAFARHIFLLHQPISLLLNALDAQSNLTMVLLYMLLSWWGLLLEFTLA